MSTHSSAADYSSLGEYLRETRINLGIDLMTVVEQTRISSKNLQALEENDFVALPADAFARGFYTLYAKCLSLDPEEILELYSKERPRQHKEPSPMLPPSKLAQEVSNMAERPTVMPFSFFGVILLSLLFLGGFLCWYFSWNPATYLSQKLRSLDTSRQIEQVTEYRTDPGVWDSTIRVTQQQSSYPRRFDLFSLSSPSSATAAIAQNIPKNQTSPPPHVSKFQTNTKNNEKTTINLTLDDLRGTDQGN